MARRPGMRDHPPAASEGVWQVMSQPTRRRGRLRSGGAGPSIASIIAGRDVNTLNNPSGGAATIHRQHHCRPGWLHAHQSLSYEGVWHGGQVGSNASALPRLARAGTALPKMAMGVRGRLLPSPTGFSLVKFPACLSLHRGPAAPSRTSSSPSWRPRKRHRPPAASLVDETKSS